jgi:methenyltetrahydrofolate cyclohydrolase
VTQAASVRFRDLSLEAFVGRLASSDPVPGGGTASAAAAAMAAGLVRMVAVLSDRPRYAAHAGLHAEARATAERLATRFLELAEEDADAYAAFAAALKLPRTTDAEAEARSRRLSETAQVAAEVPLACAEACLEVVAATEALAGRSNANASSDLVVAALLAEAAARGAAANVVVNAPSIADGAVAGRLVARSKELLDEIERLTSATRQAVLSGEAREPLVPSAG